MKFLTDLGNQLAAMFASLNPAARVVSGLIVAGIIASMAFLVQGTQPTGMVFIDGGRSFTQEEIRSIEGAFSDKGLNEYDLEGSRIKVPKNKRAEYIAALVAARALRTSPGQGPKEALEQGNPLETLEKAKTRSAISKQNNLADRIEQLPGIEWADVTYDETRQGFGRGVIRTASVAVKRRDGEALSDDMMRHIARMVSSAYAGLKPEDVHIFDAGSGQGYDGKDTGPGGAEDPYKRHQMAYESDYRRKIADLLDVYGEFKLAVGVTLDDTVLNESQQLKYDPQAITIEENTSRKDVESSKVAPGGRPGAGPNAGIGNQPVAVTTAPDQTSKSKEVGESMQRVVGQEITRTAKAGLVPKRVTVSVGIPDTYLQKVFLTKWLRDNKDKKAADAPTPTDTDLQPIYKSAEDGIKQAITAILPPETAGADRFPLVSVYQYPEMPAEPFPEPQFAEQAALWFSESWETLGLFMLVIAGMGTIAFMARSKTGTAEDPFRNGFGISLVDKIQDNLEINAADGKEGEDNEVSKLRKIEVTGQELKDSLNSMIDENPDAAINLLRTWIGEAV